MRRIKIPQQDFELKMPGGLMCEGGGVFAGHYGISFSNRNTKTIRKLHKPCISHFVSQV